MIWVTASSQSCFCWLYRASPSLVSKNIINFGVDHLVMSMCRVFSCVVGRGCLVWPVRSLGKTLVAFALIYFVLHDQTWLLLQVSLDFLLFHSSPLWWKRHIFLVLVLDGLVCHHRTVNFSFFGIGVWGIDLHHCDIEWFTLETNRDHSVIFDISTKDCISDSLLTMRANPFLLKDSCPQ